LLKCLNGRGIQGSGLTSQNPSFQENGPLLLLFGKEYRVDGNMRWVTLPDSMQK